MGAREDANRRTRGRGGFTLIEVMISFSILAAGLLSLSAMQIFAMQGGRSGRHATHAAAIAQTQMEQLQRTAWTSLGVTGGWTTGVAVGSVVQGETDKTEQSYTLSWRIADVVPNWTRAIDVRVTWGESDGRNRSVTLSSIRYNREGT